MNTQDGIKNHSIQIKGMRKVKQLLHFQQQHVAFQIAVSERTNV